MNSEELTSLADVRRIVSGLLKGLQMLHQKEIYHLEIAPDNIVVSESCNSNKNMDLNQS